MEPIGKCQGDNRHPRGFDSEETNGRPPQVSMITFTLLPLVRGSMQMQGRKRWWHFGAA
jgi:hypothetical protein